MLCYEERDLGVVYEMGQGLEANLNQPHICCDSMVLVTQQLKSNYKFSECSSKMISKMSSSLTLIRHPIRIRHHVVCMALIR